MHIKDAVIEFLDYLAIELNRSSFTRSGYEKDLNVFLRFLQSRGWGNITLQELTQEHLSAYVRYLSKEKGSEANTIRRHVTTLKSFGIFLVDTEYLEKNPAANLQRPRMPQKQPRYLSKKEVKCLFDAVPQEGSQSQLRDKTILMSLYYTGARVSELVNIRSKDVDLESSFVKIHKGKGDKFRGIPLHDKLKKQLEKYRTGAPGLINGFLFCNKDGQRITPDYVHYMINEYAAKALLKNKVTPHVLRHSFATNLYRDSVEITTVGKMMGHANLRSTSVYTHSDLKHLRAAVDRLDVPKLLEIEILKMEEKAIETASID